MRQFTRPVRDLGKLLLDFALPARCAGCADVIDEVGAFCPTCWGAMEWLGNSGCQQCGLPLEGTEADTCGRCLADPPKLDRMRAAVAYDDLPRSIALRLKYGGKVALARTMARYMSPLRGDWESSSVLIPVPLHRWRLWRRGFNQSSLVAQELSKSWGLATERRLLRRVKRTQPLKGMNHAQRRKGRRGRLCLGRCRSYQRENGHPCRRCTDQRQHGGGLCQGAATGRSKPNRVDLLGEGGSPGAAHALTLGRIRFAKE